MKQCSAEVLVNSIQHALSNQHWLRYKILAGSNETEFRYYSSVGRLYEFDELKNVNETKELPLQHASYNISVTTSHMCGNDLFNISLILFSEGKST